MKMKIIALFFLITALILVKVTFYPSLNSISLDGVQKVSEISSPDNNYKFNMYLYGGVSWFKFEKISWRSKVSNGLWLRRIDKL